MSSRVNQKERTRRAIVAATRDLIRTGGEVTMPAVAKSALVSEATAYRYFPDLASLLREALAGLWPSPEAALAPVEGSDDPVERVACATQALLRHVLTYQSGVRAMIAATITRPGGPAVRPGHRFGLIDYALRPLAATMRCWPSSSGISPWLSAPRPCSPSPTCAACPPRTRSPAPSAPPALSRRPPPEKIVWPRRGSNEVKDEKGKEPDHA